MMTILSFRHRNYLRQGFSLTEAIIFLGIVGFVMAAIWTAASETRRRNSTNQTLGEILQITQNMRSLFVNQATFDGTQWPTTTDITQAMIRAEVIPPAMINRSVPSQMISSWGTRVNLKVGATLDQFDIEFVGVLDREICRALVASAGGPAHDPGLIQITTSVGGPFAGANLNTLTGVTAPNCTSATFTFNLKG